jgi:hypothetical protein
MSDSDSISSAESIQDLLSLLQGDQTDPPPERKADGPASDVLRFMNFLRHGRNEDKEEHGGPKSLAALTLAGGSSRTIRSKPNRSGPAQASSPLQNSLSTGWDISPSFRQLSQDKSGKYTLESDAPTGPAPADLESLPSDIFEVDSQPPTMESAMPGADGYGPWSRLITSDRRLSRLSESLTGASLDGNGPPASVASDQADSLQQGRVFEVCAAGSDHVHVHSAMPLCVSNHSRVE